MSERVYYYYLFLEYPFSRPEKVRNLWKVTQHTLSRRGQEPRYAPPQLPPSLLFQ
jgi:hypothetical protein